MLRRRHPGSRVGSLARNVTAQHAVRITMSMRVGPLGLGRVKPRLRSPPQNPDEPFYFSIKPSLSTAEGARSRAANDCLAACSGLGRAKFSPLRQRTRRRVRSENVDRREAGLAVASLPSRSSWLAPRRSAQRSNLRRVGSRSSWHRDLQLASVQPQRLPLHASLVQDTPSGSMSINSPALIERALVGQLVNEVHVGRRGDGGRAC